MARTEPTVTGSGSIRNNVLRSSTRNEYPWSFLGLITLERVTLDGTKIKANAGGNSFRRQEKIAAHLAFAREQVRVLNAQAADEEKLPARQAGARRRAARQRASRLEAACREVERLQREKIHDRKTFSTRASCTDPEAHVMRNGDGGTVPSEQVASPFS